jgi:hypothetical protein
VNKVTKTMKQSFLGYLDSKISKEKLIITKDECDFMIRSKKCVERSMYCEGSVCSFNEEPPGFYTWMKENKFEYYECKTNTKLIVAENNDSIIFSSKNNCKANDLYCLLHDSIVIWNASIVKKSNYERLFYGEAYSNYRNKLVSPRNKYLFELTDYEITVDNIKMRGTTEGLLIAFMKPNMTNDSFSNMELTRTTKQFHIMNQKARNDLIISERDYEEYTIDNNLRVLSENLSKRLCSLLKTQLNIIKTKNNELIKIYDTNANEIILYVENNLIFIPFCTTIRYINISNQTDCFHDTPVTPDIKNNAMRLFLTKNNYLIDKSQLVNCESINTRQLLPSGNTVLIRSGNKTKINNISELIVEHLALNQLKLKEINFDHHDYLINDNNIDLELYKKIINDDLSGNYYSYPDDNANTDNFFKFSTSEKQGFMEKQIEILYYFYQRIKITIYSIIITITLYFSSRIFWKLLNRKRIRKSPEQSSAVDLYELARLQRKNNLE